MTYNERNRHPRDARVEFEPESHIYRVDGTEFDSVTTVIESLFEQFDAEYWAQRKATPGHTAEMILAEWRAKGEAARNLGTEMHDRIERYYLGEPVMQWMDDATFRLFGAFACDVRLRPARTEWRIFHEEARIAGTLDFLGFNASGDLEIWDWKRSSKIVNSLGLPLAENIYGKTAFEPLEHVPDTTFHHYALQVSIYRRILEEKYRLKIAACHLGVFYPDYDRYWVVDVPYLADEVDAILNARMAEMCES